MKNFHGYQCNSDKLRTLIPEHVISNLLGRLFIVFSKLQLPIMGAARERLSFNFMISLSRDFLLSGLVRMLITGLYYARPVDGRNNND